MRKFLLLTVALLLAAALFSGVPVDASPPPGENAKEKPIREIYVPFEHLDVLLQNQPRRVLLSREDFAKLIEKAKKSPETEVPTSAVLLSADYDATIETERAVIDGKLTLEVLEEGLHALPLSLSGVGLASATVDGRDAAIGRNRAGVLTLLVEGVGRHVLELKMVAPLETTAARQILNYRLPRPPAATFHLTVPGDVEVKSGAKVVSRELQDDPRVTLFELLPTDAHTTLELSLNSRLRRKEQALLARSVFVNEVTQAYEKLHARVSMVVLHRAVDRFQFVVPTGFEVTEISSPALARWDVEADGDRRLLNVYLREETTDTVTLDLSAIKTPSTLEAWSLPRLEPLGVVGQVAIAGLLVEDRLDVEDLVPTSLIPLDTEVLRRAAPSTIFNTAPGTPPLREVVAFYAPQGEFGLTARFVKPQAEMAVTSSRLLVIADKGQEMLGGINLLLDKEKRFGFDLSVPKGWHIESVTGAGEQPLAFERYGAEDEAGRIRVRVPKGIPVGTPFQVNFQATSTPIGWLDVWETKEIAFPIFAVRGSTRDRGAIAIEVRDDMVVRPAQLEKLTPLDDDEKKEFGLGGVETNLAYRCEGADYAATLTVERTRAQIAARTFSFLKVKPDALVAHYELIFEVDEARTRRLVLALPEDTPEALSIRGLDGLKIKEFTNKIVDGQRRWTIELAEPQSGTLRLAVDFQQRAAIEDTEDLELPIVLARNVAFQSGMIAVEGDAELDVQVDAGDARRVDVGELVDADYMPGRRLLGAFQFIGEPPTVKINVSRHPTYGLYRAIVEMASIDTYVSASGAVQTQAVFRLRTKAMFLEIELPAGAQLWSAELDGMPVKPQREGDRLLVSLPAKATQTTRQLKITYADTIAALGVGGAVRVNAPKLGLRGADEKSPSVAVPLNDLQWKLHLPEGYRVSKSNGTIVATRGGPRKPMPAAVNVLGAVFYLAGGGVPPMWGAIGAIQDSTAGLSEMPSMMPRMGRANKSAPAKQWAASPATTEEAPAADEMMELELDLPAPAFRGTPVPSGAEFAEKEPEEKMEELEELKKHVELDKTEAVAAPADAPAEPDAVPTPKPPTLVPEPSIVQPPAEGEEPPPPPKPDAGVDRPETATKDDAKKPLGLKSRVDKLAGVRSLRIDLTQNRGRDRWIEFRSLGVDPELDVALTSKSQYDYLAWGLGLLTVLIGLAMTKHPARTKVQYILAIFVLGTLVPLLSESVMLATLCNAIVYGAAALIPYYLIVALLRWFTRWAVQAWYNQLRRRRKGAATVAALLVSFCWMSSAEAAPPVKARGGTPPYVIQVVDPTPPVTVPADALILPYDPEWKNGIKDADRVLVPYKQYVELWNRANPDKKLETPAPPTPYALAGAAYQTTLMGDDYLLVTGKVQIDVFTDEYVTIPLRLSGGVLGVAELDGKPAKLSAIQAMPVGANNAPNRPDQPNPAPIQQIAVQQIANQRKQQAAPVGPMVMLYVSGKGRHTLDLSIRMRLTRQGGWRVAGGILPAAPATSMEIIVPKAETELRLGNVADRRSYETEKPNETIRTALSEGGGISIRWRPKVAEGEVDRTLTAKSTAVLDVQEDGLRLVWQVVLEFRRSQREQFTVDVPAAYLVEKVDGSNVRGWEATKEGERQTVEITLLNAAKDREKFTLHLWRGGSVGHGDLAEFDAPAVRVPDAALHSGELTVRRSPLLDLRTVQSKGLTRTNLTNTANQLAGGEDNEESPLGIRAYQAFRFSTMPFTLRLGAEPITPEFDAQVQSILRLADYNRELESNVLLSIQKGTLFRFEMAVPNELEIEHVHAPGEFEWVVTEPDGKRLLSVYFAEGQQGTMSVVVRGVLGKPERIQELALPKLEVLGARRQRGDFAVQVRQGWYDLRLDAARNCESVLLRQISRWLSSGQREATQLAVAYREADYAGTLKITPRKPQVTSTILSNIRVTNRVIEETILLIFDIKEAGISKVSFELPPHMADAKITVEDLRQKTIEKADDGADDGANDGAGKPVTVHLELQDQIIGEYVVQVQKDRMLTAGKHVAPIPVVKTGRMNQRFVAVENSGTDELEFTSTNGLQLLSRQQREWQTIKDLLESRITQAYLVDPDADAPELIFTTKQRESIKTAGAKIGLAETVLILDRNGAYRAEVTYHLSNTTEQFLDIELPAGARLWAAQVAGEPVKPTEVPGTKNAQMVRIPIVKTAEGDLDYAVQLYYGGKIDRLKTLSKVDFPLVKVRMAGNNAISVAYSQVKLLVPKTHKWFDFGGTMGKPKEEKDLEGQYNQYQTDQVQRLLDVARHGDKFARARSVNNLKQIGLGYQDFSSAGEYGEAQSKLANLLQEGQQEIEKAQQPEQFDYVGNRGRLNERYANQTLTRSRDVVKDLGYNWESSVSSKPQSGEKPTFNPNFLDNNNLANAPVQPAPGQDRGGQQGQQQGQKAGQSEAQGRHWKFGKGKPSAQPVAQQPAAVEVAQGKTKKLLQKGQALQKEISKRNVRGPEKQVDAVQRYEERLKQQQAIAVPQRQMRRLGESSRGGGRSVQSGMQAPGVIAGDLDIAFEDTTVGDVDDIVIVTDGADSMLGVVGGLGTAPTGGTGLASLEMNLPNMDDMCETYLFTTPLGDVAIDGRAASVSVIDRLIQFGIVVAVLVVLWIVVALVRRGVFRWLRSRPAAIAMICIGAFCFVVAIFPVAAIALLVTGIVFTVRQAET